MEPKTTAQAQTLTEISDSAEGATEATPPSQPDEATVDPEALVAELEEARRQASESYDRYLRVHAEMDNYKKRIERTYADLSRNSKKDLLLRLLNVKDNLERALSYGGKAAAAENESVIQGVRLTEYQLDQILRAEGVTSMDLAGQPFDPSRAEAVSTVVSADLPDHSVAEVIQQGYLYQDQVLRPAKVIVTLREKGEGL